MNKMHTHYNTRQTPQSEPIPGREADMSRNSAGGFSFKIDAMKRLDRFLVLGTEGGTYYSTERALTRENAKAVRELIDSGRGLLAVQRIVEISDAGRAPRNDPALFALAICAGLGDPATRAAALEALPRVARIGTHLFHFATYVESFRGWGRSLRRAIARWYLDKPVSKLAYDAIKYRQRDGWSHRDLLRLSHPVVNDRLHESFERNTLFSWIVKASFEGQGNDGVPTPNAANLPLEYTPTPGPLTIVEGFERAQAAETPADTARLIKTYGLPREALRTEHLTSPEVWMALLEKGMPLGALVRNLGNMTRVGVLGAMTPGTKTVVDALANEEAIRKSRLHPFSILLAMRTYAEGVGFRGQNTWNPVAKVVDALDKAFYLAFANIEPTGKRFLLALDVSGSMGTPIMDSPLTARDATAALALVTAATEPNHQIVGFTSSGRGGRYGGRWDAGAAELTELAISPRQRLTDAIKVVSGLPFGGTDCALPMVWAQEHGHVFDVFVVLTDSETWAGNIQPAQALRKYRETVNPDARLVVVGMTATGFSIADPADAGMLDVVGFDTAVPQLLREFAVGNI